MPSAAAMRMNIHVLASQAGTITVWEVDITGTLRQVSTQAAAANTPTIIRYDDNFGPLMVQYVPAAACTLTVTASYSGGGPA